MRHRDVMASSFDAGISDDADSFNPTDGLSNLADCMLVLACGLMVALVVNFNVDMNQDLVEVQETDSMIQVQEEDVSEAVVDTTSQQNSGSNMYQELGMLYKDPSTGKMYYLSEQGDSSSGSKGDK